MIVNETSMVGSAKLARLARLADRQPWRVVLVGDPDRVLIAGLEELDLGVVDASVERARLELSGRERPDPLEPGREAAGVEPLRDEEGRCA